MTGSSSTAGWNYGDILDAVDATVDPARPALIHTDRVVQWRDFTRRTNNLARALRDRGAQPGDKIAFYMRNRAEYSEGIAAAFKARLTHVNVNYRYVDHELVYLLDNADATVVLYTAEFAPRVAAIRTQLPKVRQWVEVTDGYPGTEDVIAYETLANGGNGLRWKNFVSPRPVIAVSGAIAVGSSGFGTVSRSVAIPVLQAVTNTVCPSIAETVAVQLFSERWASNGSRSSPSSFRRSRPGTCSGSSERSACLPSMGP
jgi:acyl-CoA synthetase (AMP-forming)/AMP-acid ligase II